MLDRLETAVCNILVEGREFFKWLIIFKGVQWLRWHHVLITFVEDHDVFSFSDVCYGETDRLVGLNVSTCFNNFDMDKWAWAPIISSSSGAVMISG